MACLVEWIDVTLWHRALALMPKSEALMLFGNQTAPSPD
jgi:hypothetical protein